MDFLDFMVSKVCFGLDAISRSLLLVDLEKWLNFLNYFNSGPYSEIWENYNSLSFFIVIPNNDVSEIVTFLNQSFPNFSCFS